MKRSNRLKPLRLKKVPAMTFEKALAALRRGRRIRRRAWHADSAIFRLGGDVFVKLPDAVQRGPSVWKPYPQDVLATDWTVCK